MQYISKFTAYNIAPYIIASLSSLSCSLEFRFIRGRHIGITSLFLAIYCARVNDFFPQTSSQQLTLSYIQANSNKMLVLLACLPRFLVSAPKQFFNRKRATKCIQHRALHFRRVITRSWLFLTLNSCYISYGPHACNF